jgi:hypothetical protein
MGSADLLIYPGKLNFYYRLCKIRQVLLNRSAFIRGVMMNGKTAEIVVAASM